MCFWTGLNSEFQKYHFEFQKYHFYPVRCLEMHQMVIWKNDIINRSGFGAIRLPKIDDILTRKLGCQMSRYGSISFCFWGILIIFILTKIVCKFQFSLFWGWKITSWKIWDGHFKEFFIQHLLVLWICILLLNFYF